MTKRILMAGGGTGGHLFPGLALASALKRQCGIDVSFLCGGRDTERKILAGAGVSSEDAVLGGSLWSPLSNLHRWRTLQRIFSRARPDAFIGLGGGPSVLPGVIARLRSLPIFLLEQNRVLGRANRLLAPIARRIFLTYCDTRGSRALRRSGIAIGCPVRTGFRPAPLPAGDPAVLVLGGSLGAEDLNRLLEASLRRLEVLRGRVRFHHITGPGKAQRLAGLYRAAGIEAEVHEFVEEPSALFLGAGIVIARAGGSTIAEITAVGRGALLLPYPYHRDRHQFANAEALAKAGAARIVSGEPEAFSTILRALLLERRELEAMAEAAAALGRPEAAKHIAEIIGTHLESAPTGADLRGRPRAGAA